MNDYCVPMSKDEGTATDDDEHATSAARARAGGGVMAQVQLTSSEAIGLLVCYFFACRSMRCAWWIS